MGKSAESGKVDGEANASDSADMSKRLESNSGVHVHTLERENLKTKTDGAHRHLFEVDGEFFLSEEDGEHLHTLNEPEQDRYLYGGEHFHRVTLPDGTEVETEIGEGHDHTLQVGQTGFDGGHAHRLKIPGGAVVSSLMGGEFWRDALGSPDQAGNTASPPASEVAASKAICAAFKSFKVKSQAIYVQGSTVYVDGSQDLAKSAESALGIYLSDDVAKGVNVVCGVPVGASTAIADLTVTTAPPIKVWRMSTGPADDGLLPAVLTWKAVVSGWMPADGKSGLPESIEECIPEALQFWKSKAPKTSRAMLFDAGIVTKKSLVRVGDELRLSTQKRYLVDAGRVNHEFVGVAGSVESTIRSEIAGSKPMCFVSGSVADIAKSDPDAISVFSPESIASLIECGNSLSQIAKSLTASTFDYIAVIPDSVAARHAFSGLKPFTIQKSALAGCILVTNTDSVSGDRVGDGDACVGDASFMLIKQDLSEASSVWHLQIGDEAWVVQQDPSVGKSTAIASDVTKDIEGTKIDSGAATFVGRDVGEVSVRFDGNILRGIRKFERVGKSSIWSFSDGQPEKTVKSYGVNELIVKEDDGDDDERFVLGVVLEPDGVDSQQDTISPEEIRSAAHGFMLEHQIIGIQHKQIAEQIHILESYIAPVDFEMSGRKIRKGTWLLAVKVLDDGLWIAIKDGSFTGFSIGGSAVRKPAI